MSLQLRAAMEIGAVMLVSVLAFILEVALADFLPWGIESRGVLAVLSGCLAALAVTLFAGRPFSHLGFRKPARWWVALLWAVGIFLFFGIAQNLVPIMVNLVIELPQPDYSRYDFIKGNLTAAILMAIGLPLLAAVPEEIIYRGFLIERLHVTLGEFRGSEYRAVVLQALIFGAIHFQWGVGGVLVTVIMGLVWGLAFLLCGRNLWIVIFAHSLGHVVLVSQIYTA